MGIKLKFFLSEKYFPLLIKGKTDSKIARFFYQFSSELYEQFNEVIEEIKLILFSFDLLFLLRGLLGWPYSFYWVILWVFLNNFGLSRGFKLGINISIQ